MAKIKCYCTICKKYIGSFYPSLIRKVHSGECKRKITSINNKGVNNPNYRHGKNIENRCKDCNKLIDCRSERCHRCRSIANNSFKGKKHSDQSKKLIGEKSSKKFTDEYIERVRKVYENRGLWIPSNEVSEYIKYYRKCEWDKEIPKVNDFHRTRHHRFSRYDGFRNNINPLIMKHPVNCRIITRKENISIKNNSEITKDELYNMILNYKGNWFGHSLCLDIIKRK